MFVSIFIYFDVNMYHKIKSIDTIHDIESIQNHKHFEKYFEFGSMSISTVQLHVQ
ncbi:hypothetical protein CsSME_00045760 [Camellia sinensis var. sinensis]